MESIWCKTANLPDRKKLDKNLHVQNAVIGAGMAGLVKGLFGHKSKRCSHMGCHLEWNEEEHTWDCPCHGSRFGKDGDLIDNPAKRNLKNI